MKNLKQSLIGSVCRIGLGTVIVYFLWNYIIHMNHSTILGALVMSLCIEVFSGFKISENKK